MLPLLAQKWLLIAASLCVWPLAVRFFAPAVGRYWGETGWMSVVIVLLVSVPPWCALLVRAYALTYGKPWSLIRAAVLLLLLDLTFLFFFDLAPMDVFNPTLADMGKEGLVLLLSTAFLDLLLWAYARRDTL